MALLMNVNDVRHDLHKIRGTRTMCAELFVNLDCPCSREFHFPSSHPRHGHQTPFVSTSLLAHEVLAADERHPPAASFLRARSSFIMAELRCSPLC